MREALGLNRPLLEQYLQLHGRTASLDLGRSHFGPPVTDAGPCSPAMDRHSFRVGSLPWVC